MKIVWEKGDEQKLLEKKREEMNKLIGLNNISIKENITLLINDWCAEHIKTLHKEYPHTEWLAVCKVEPQGKWVFLMTDMIFPWQKGVGWEVETTKEWMEWLNNELIKRNENGKLWNCILHSHHWMGCFWSGTDDNARLWMNDWRQVEWAVVTAYDKEDKNKISYKGCVNFYKPYNIEIDVEVMNSADMTIVDKYNDYLWKIAESEVAFYEFLTEENKEYIDSITKTPSYSRVLEYLWVDITDDLVRNYNELNDKIWNPELLDYLKQLTELSHKLAVEEISHGGEYADLLAEYGAFCEWSDNLLTQLEENRKNKSTVVQGSLVSQTSYPENRYLEDDYEWYDYEFTADKYAESYVRHMFRILGDTPMKLWEKNEWLVWSYVFQDYIYVEDYEDNYYYY